MAQSFGPLVKIQHTATGILADVLPSTVTTWVSQGWTVVENGNEEVVDQPVPDPDDQSGEPDVNEE